MVIPVEWRVQKLNGAVMSVGLVHVITSISTIAAIQGRPHIGQISISTENRRLLHGKYKERRHNIVFALCY